MGENNTNVKNEINYIMKDEIKPFAPPTPLSSDFIDHVNMTLLKILIYFALKLPL